MYKRQDSNLADGRTYYYRIRATNAVTTDDAPADWSNEASATTIITEGAVRFSPPIDQSVSFDVEFEGAPPAGLPASERLRLSLAGCNNQADCVNDGDWSTGVIITTSQSPTQLGGLGSESAYRIVWETVLFDVGGFALNQGNVILVIIPPAGGRGYVAVTNEYMQVVSDSENQLPILAFETGENKNEVDGGEPCVNGEPECVIVSGEGDMEANPKRRIVMVTASTQFTEGVSEWDASATAGDRRLSGGIEIRTWRTGGDSVSFMIAEIIPSIQCTGCTISEIQSRISVPNRVDDGVGALPPDVVAESPSAFTGSSTGLPSALPIIGDGGVADTLWSGSGIPYKLAVIIMFTGLTAMGAAAIARLGGAFVGGIVFLVGSMIAWILTQGQLIDLWWPILFTATALAFIVIKERQT